MLTKKGNLTHAVAAAILILAFTGTTRAGDERKNDKEGAAGAKSGLKVSYDKQVRPIFQAHCQGCHQPAKAGGGYVMTAFDRLKKGGESDEVAIVPGKPAESYLVEQITPEKDGKAVMPQNKPPLSAAEIELVKRWIAEGAVDDVPKAAHARYDMDHPPVYTRLPVVPALAFAPMGRCWRLPAFTKSCSGRPTAPSWWGAWWACRSASSHSRFHPMANGWPSRVGGPR